MFSLHGDESAHNQTLKEAFSPDTPDEERIAAVRELLPEDRKHELINSAELNLLGDHVRYYRVIGPGESLLLLSGETATPLTSPTIRSDFENNKGWLLESFGRDKELRLSPEFYTILPDLLQQFGENPTLEHFMEVASRSIPRYDLFKLHVKQMQYINNYHGIMSLSVGVPLLAPSGFKEQRGELVGSAVAEFVIPNTGVLIFPPSGGLRETEKEVNTLGIKPEWLVDLYTTDADFAERFIASDGSILSSQYQQLKEKEGEILWLPYHAHELIMNYKHSHMLDELIPVSKISETNPDNPLLKKPIL